MAQRDDITTPQLERGDAFSSSPSPAREALQCNLDTTLSLTRKKSGWFGSARETLARGALSAKGYIDSIRGENSSRAGDDIFEDRSEPILNEEALIGGDEDDTSSITPLRPCAERSRTFTPKSAMTSLRQHVKMSSKAGQKRGALAEITGNAAHHSVVEGADGPEKWMNDGKDAQDTVLDREGNDPPAKGHARKTSLGRSLVGSIRRMTMSPRNSSPSRGRSYLSPSKVAAEVPLPSSPIDIPAPSLSLDLGSFDGLVPSDFGRSPLKSRVEPLMMLTDPRMATMKDLSALKAQIPLEISLHNPRSSECAPTLATAPSTSLQKIDLAFGLDGARTETTRPELFERSVDRAGKKDRSLRKMVSLDAIAKQSNKSLLDAAPSDLLQPDVPSGLRHQSSLTTIESCPTDLPNLTRQLAKLQNPDAGHRDPMDGEWKSDDPFAPGNIVGDVAARRMRIDKDIELPFRPKIVVQAVETGQSTALNEEGSGLNSLKELEKAAELPADAAHIGAAKVEEVVRPQPVYQPVAQELRALISRTNFRDSELSGSGDYDDFKTRHMFPALVDLDVDAEHEDVHSNTTRDPHPSSTNTEGSSQPPAQIMSNLYKRISTSQTPSPGRTRASTTHSADVGDMFWNFAVRDWVHAGAEGEPSTPYDADTSISSVEGQKEQERPSDDVDRQTPVISPTVSTPGIGSRLSFDLKRSDRNMRYNALHCPTSTSPQHEDVAVDVVQPLQPSLKFVTGSLNNGSKSSISLLGYVPNNSSVEDVVGGCGDGSPSLIRRSRSRRRRSRDDDSMDQVQEDLERSLQMAIAEHYHFQVAMAGLEIGEDDLDAVNEQDAARDGSVGFDNAHDPARLTESPGRAAVNGEVNSAESSGARSFELEDQPADAIEADTLDEALEMFRTYSHSQQDSPEQHDALEAYEAFDGSKVASP